MIFKLVQTKMWDYTIILVIVLNTLTLAFRTVNDTEKFRDTITLINLCLTMFQVCEILLELIGYGPQYFNNNENTFDFVVIGVCAMYTPAQFYSKSTKNHSLQLLRFFRISKYFSSKSAGAHSLKVLISTLHYVLPQLLNIVSLMLLFIFIYAVIGVNMFANIKHSYPMN